MYQITARRFSFVADLLYPAALGAGIAWWCEGFIGWRAHETTGAPASWALVFGLFFIVYHARNFIVLRDEYGGTDADGWAHHMRYQRTTFTRDVIDCVALVAAFMCLRFPGGNIRLMDPVGIYLVALLIPAGALITDARRERMSWLWRGVSCIPPLVGVVTALLTPSEHFTPGIIDWAVLVSLWLLLLAYIASPAWFGVRSRLDVPDAELQGLVPNLRVASAAAVSIILIAGATWHVRAEAAPIAAAPVEHDAWTLVGRVGDFAAGRPCLADSLAQQVAHLDSLLLRAAPSQIRLVGSADVAPLTALSREFVGNNAGLARFRAECVQRWLLATDHFAGVAFEVNEDAPTNLGAADPIDRSVLVFVKAAHR